MFHRVLSYADYNYGKLSVDYNFLVLRCFCISLNVNVGVRIADPEEKQQFYIENCIKLLYKVLCVY